MKKSIGSFFAILAVLIIFIGASPVSANSNIKKVSSDALDITKKWEVLEYESDLNIDLEDIFTQGGAREGTGIKYATYNFANIGNAKLHLRRTIKLKENTTYKMNFVYGFDMTMYAKGLTTSLVINDKVIVDENSDRNLDTPYVETVKTTDARDYIIDMKFDIPKNTGFFMMVGYDSDLVDGGITEEVTTEPSTSSSDTSDTGSTTDTSDTGSTTDTSDAGSTTDTSDTGSTTDTSDTGSTTDTSDTGSTTDTSDTGSTTDTSDTGSATDTSTTGDSSHGNSNGTDGTSGGKDVNSNKLPSAGEVLTNPIVYMGLATLILGFILLFKLRKERGQR